MDPLTQALEEAETLMQTIDTSGSADFAIDSDDEDDLALNFNAATPSLSQQQVPAADTNQLHPLHDAFLSTPTATATTTTAQSTSSSSLFSGTSTAAAAAGLPSAAAPSMDVLKASTSRFASNLATMAQRAATQVSTAATEGAAAAGTLLQTTSTSATSPSQPPYPQQQQQLHPQSSASQQQSSYGQPSLFGTSPATPVTTNNHTAAATAVPNNPVPELDQEQKNMLIETHVGALIPGERVIMFLSNLLHVSDSSGFQYNHQHQPAMPHAASNAPQPTVQAGVWCCAMTFYRIILFSTHPVRPEPKPDDWNYACWPQKEKSVLQMPLATLHQVEKSVFSAGAVIPGTPRHVPNTLGSVGGGSGTPATTSHMGLVLTSKHNGRHIRFTTASYQDTGRAFDALSNYAFPGRRNLGYLFAFESKRERVMASLAPDATTGQKVVTLDPCRKRFDGVREFQRQFDTAGFGPSAPWSVWTQSNANYQLCLSYPSVLAGPVTLDEAIYPDAGHLVRQCASFRSEQRLPALTWCASRDGGGASVWRCAQPKIGLQGNRSAADELFLKHILERAAAANAMSGSGNNNTNGGTGGGASVPSSTVPSRFVLQQLTGSSDLSNWMPTPTIGLKILDLRPRSSAMANRTGGYGYENTSNYTGCSLQFCNIGNIHAVRDSYNKMSQLCLSSVTPDLQFNTALEDTKWLSHIRLIWAAAWETAYWVHVHKMPVLLHCSHGWDRTSQVAVLAQLLLDPFYRTLEGFSCLVEKDFMSFGHPFHTRCGHGEGRDGAGGGAGAGGGGAAVDEGQISPIFLQFLDCVFQLVHQYPECFEFNTKYVLLLSEHIYSCRFGNFLCDTERERETGAAIRQRTNSLWDYLDGHDECRNMQYSAKASAGVLLMPLPTLTRNIVLWADRHCAHGPKATTRWCPENNGGITEHSLKNDQPCSLVTEQDIKRLVLPVSQQGMSTSSETTRPTNGTKTTTAPMKEEELVASAPTSNSNDPVPTPAIPPAAPTVESEIVSTPAPTKDDEML